MIDIHVHITHEEEARLSRARAAGVETSILLSTRVHPEGARGIADLADRLAGLSGVVGGTGDTGEASRVGDQELVDVLSRERGARGMWKVPLEEDPLQVTQRVAWAAARPQIVGIGELTPPPGGVHAIEPVLRACTEAAGGMPVLVHGFAPNTAQDLEEYAQLAARYPRVPLIIGACGGLNALRAIELATQRRNIYLDVSSALQVFVLRVALAELPERCLFGSNTPYGDPVASRAFVEAATTDEFVRVRVFHDNAAELFGL